MDIEPVSKQTIQITDPAWDPFFSYFQQEASLKERYCIKNHFLFTISNELKKVFQKSLERLKAQKWSSS